MDKLSVKEYKDPFEKKGIREENKKRGKKNTGKKQKKPKT